MTQLPMITDYSSFSWASSATCLFEQGALSELDLKSFQGRLLRLCAAKQKPAAATSSEQQALVVRVQCKGGSRFYVMLHKNRRMWLLNQVIILMLWPVAFELQHWFHASFRCVLATRRREVRAPTSVCCQHWVCLQSFWKKCSDLSFRFHEYLQRLPAICCR